MKTREEILGLIQMALDELGVPTDDYPAPVANEPKGIPVLHLPGCEIPKCC